MIKVLDNETIDKIAAGEVVERPESVVKELVENSIDSGAANIDVEIREGGLSLIRVTDNGSGIDGSDIRNAFVRHATSKLNDASDLYHIFTMGFRGEALASISGVSETELITKVKDSLNGIRYKISGGKELLFSEIGAPDGTTILVKNLFYNVPVRKKFLKTPATEGSYVNDILEKLALSRPDISFSFSSDGRQKFRTNGTSSLFDVIYTIYGKQISSELLPIDYSNERISIKGFVGKPVISRNKRDFELFFVNNRYIYSDILRKALEEAVSSYMMQHRFPFAIIKINIDPSLIDVNIHPKKSELKFSDPASVYGDVFNAVKDAFREKELIAEPVKFESNKEGRNKNLSTGNSANANTNTNTNINGANSRSFLPFEKTRQYKYEAEFLKFALNDSSYATSSEENNTNETIVSDTNTGSFSDNINTKNSRFLDEKNISNFRIIGQVFKTYWIIEFNDEMYLIDQHAAHEKVNYEEYMQDIDNHSVESQMIMPPIILALSAKETAILNDKLPLLNSMGYSIENAEGNDFYVRAVPSNIPDISEKELLIELIDSLSEIRNDLSSELIKSKIASMSCKAAVKGNSEITEAEMEALILKLLKCKDPYNCPHGRPTIIKFSKSDIEKMFKRIV